MNRLLAAVLVLASSYANADSAYPQLTNINTVGNGSSLQSNANMNSNVAENTTNIGNANSVASSNSNTATGGIANVNSNASGNSQSTSFSNPHQAPPVFVGAAMPTAVCQKTYSGFLSMFVFGGAGASGSVTYDDCMRLEVGRTFLSAGRPDLAVKMACRTEFGRELDECR